MTSDPNALPDEPSGPSQEEARRRRFEGLIILAAGLAVLFFALWEIRNPNARGAAGNVFSFLLINTNIILLLLLIFLVVRNLTKLVVERRQRVLGSQLKGRMVMAFVTIAAFPALVLLLVSMEFFTNTIDGWFSTEVEESLEGAWSLAHTYYEESAADALLHSRAISRAISADGGSGLRNKRRLEALVEEHQRSYNLGTVQIFDRQGEQRVVQFNEQAPTGLPLKADRELLDETFLGEDATRVEVLGESDIIRGGSPVYGGRSGEEVVGAVIVDYLVKRSAKAWSQDILDSYRDYRQLKQSRRPFRNLYILTLSLASLVVVFSATWVGIYLARSITDPIGRLAEATQDVAAGRWGVKIEETGGDEVATLVRAFNSMTGQLQTSHEDLDERRRYIENVLANVAAGVVSVDSQHLISTVNPAAVSLLGLPASGLVGREAIGVFTDAGYPEVAAMLEELNSGALPSGTRRNIQRKEEGRTLLVTATALLRRSGSAAGSVLFFEDVSQIVAVERTEAWKEVARRIAHEIKNPLTPIQLSAQRLKRRLGESVEGDDAVLFDECTTTIVDQVDHLKNLVNEFSRFTQGGDTEKSLHDLNDIVAETLPLYRQAWPDMDIGFERGESLPPVMMNRDGVKRALINLLDNAVSVSAGSSPAEANGQEAGSNQIRVKTTFDKALSRVILEVADNGPGISAEDKARVFEPYFSTKDDGTGLGLAIVASVAAEHQAYIRLRDNMPSGSRFTIEFPAKIEDAAVAETGKA